MTSAAVEERIHRHVAVSTNLRKLSGAELRQKLDSAPRVAAGIGGPSVRLDVGGVPVFAKRTPLAAEEVARPGDLGNLYGLPPYCLYGVGSPGLNGWRELAAHELVTGLVRDGRAHGFPLLHHSRVLPEPAGWLPPAPERADVPAAVAYWGGAPGVGVRTEAVTASRHSAVLFLEHVPHTLLGWLDEHAADDDAVRMVERELLAAFTALREAELLHFDAHFANILTDGRQLFVSDFGLATSPRWAAADEREFLRRNASHDLCHVMSCLVNQLVRALAAPAGFAERNAYIEKVAAGAEPAGLPSAAAEVVGRYAGVAAVLNRFYWTLHGKSRTEPYPAEEAERAWAEVAAG